MHEWRLFNLISVRVFCICSRFSILRCGFAIFPCYTMDLIKQENTPHKCILPQKMKRWKVLRSLFKNRIDAFAELERFTCAQSLFFSLFVSLFMYNIFIIQDTPYGLYHFINGFALARTTQAEIITKLRMWCVLILPLMEPWSIAYIIRIISISISISISSGYILPLKCNHLFCHSFSFSLFLLSTF